MPLTNPIFRRISRLAEEQGVRAFVVGGYVRDHFLRRPSTDIDVVVVGSGIALAEALGRELHAKVSVFKTFGTAMLRHKGVEVEFVGARRESYTQDSRKPQVEAGTLEDDQRRRDFTINAMAWSLNAGSFGELVDPFDGMDDLEECVIRTPCDPDVTFSDDPLRMMRAVRFASQLGFTIEGETFDAIRRHDPEGAKYSMIAPQCAPHPDRVARTHRCGTQQDRPFARTLDGLRTAGADGASGADFPGDAQPQGRREAGRACP